jgi:hypothetical protein
VYFSNRAAVRMSAANAMSNVTTLTARSMRRVAKAWYI